MISHKYVLRAACLLVSAFSLCVLRAQADTYQIFNLGDGNALGVYGITDSGTVVVSGSVSAGCAGNPFATSCFYTYDGGVKIASSLNAPDLPFNNGGACAAGSLPSGATLSVCNNGREAYGARFDSPMVGGLFNGPDPLADLVKAGGSVDRIMMNGMGDIAWLDGAGEYNWEAVDLTTRAAVTPEPGSLTLLASGALGLFAAARRRRRA